MRAVDTNLLVRLIVRDHPRQVIAAEEFVATGAWASALALAEAMWVLATVYRFGASEIASAVEMLLQQKELTVENAEAVTAALDLFRKHPGLGFSDCLILELARKSGHLPLGTFDRELGKVAGTEKL